MIRDKLRATLMIIVKIWFPQRQNQSQLDQKFHFDAEQPTYAALWCNYISTIFKS